MRSSSAVSTTATVYLYNQLPYLLSFTICFQCYCKTDHEKAEVWSHYTSNEGRTAQASRSATTEWKVCKFIGKCLHQMAPLYWVIMCIAVESVESHSHLRSAVRGELIIPQTKSKKYDPWIFAVAAPSVWNSLSMSTCDPLLTFPVLHECLKTELFIRVYQTVPQ